MIAGNELVMLHAPVVGQVPRQTWYCVTVPTVGGLQFRSILNFPGVAVRELGASPMAAAVFSSSSPPPIDWSTVPTELSTLPIELSTLPTESSTLPTAWSTLPKSPVSSLSPTSRDNPKMLRLAPICWKLRWVQSSNPLN